MEQSKDTNDQGGAQAEPQTITEEQGVHKAWYDEAKAMTMEALPAFLTKLTTAYKHDYGTICHAIASAAVAAAWAVERTPQGGITGFQASCIMWEFIKHWGHIDGPARLLQMENMLYPQYRRMFTTISKETWERLQAKANELLNAPNEHVHPDVIAHWESIRNGEVPFDFRLEEE